MYPGCINRLRDEPTSHLHNIVNGMVDTDECHFQAAQYLLSQRGTCGEMQSADFCSHPQSEGNRVVG